MPACFEFSLLERNCCIFIPRPFDSQVAGSCDVSVEPWMPVESHLYYGAPSIDCRRLQSPSLYMACLTICMWSQGFERRHFIAATEVKERQFWIPGKQLRSSAVRDKRYTRRPLSRCLDEAILVRTLGYHKAPRPEIFLLALVPIPLHTWIALLPSNLTEAVRIPLSATKLTLLFFLLTYSE